MRKLPADNSCLFFITTVTKDRRLLFRDRRLAERLETMIHMACRLKCFMPLAYAIMPDHLHLLVYLPRPERALEKARSNAVRPNKNCLDNDLWAGYEAPNPAIEKVAQLVQSIKGTFSRTVKPGPVWQKRYFVWHLNNAAALIRVVEYINNNPSQAGLPKYYQRQPFLWVDEYGLAEVIGASG